MVNSTSPLQMRHIPCLMHQGVGFVPEVVDIAEVIRKHMYLDHRSMRQSRKKPPAKSISSKDDATSCQPIFDTASIYSKLEESVYDDEQGIVTLRKFYALKPRIQFQKANEFGFFPSTHHNSLQSQSIFICHLPVPLFGSACMHYQENPCINASTCLLSIKFDRFSTL